MDISKQQLEDKEKLEQQLLEGKSLSPK